jgi:outer membrane protein assembly factor BamD
MLRLAEPRASQDVVRNPKRRFGPCATLIALMLAAAPLGACSSLSSLDVFNIFGDKDAVLPDEPAEKLYNEGLYLLNEKREYADASKKFSEVDRQHPYSEWARKALLMDAYAQFAGRKYEGAIASAKRFVTLHPGSPDAAYAQYLIGSSYYEQMPDVTRDQAGADRAMRELDEVIRKFPESQYAVAAKRKIEVARDQLAGKEMQIGRYYLKRRDFTGAINRFKVVVTHYQRTRHVEEALMRLAEAYMAIGIVSEAQTAAAVLGHNFPESQWYRDAYTLVKTGGHEPSANQGSWITRAFKGFGVG